MNEDLVADSVLTRSLIEQHLSYCSTCLFDENHSINEQEAEEENDIEKSIEEWQKTATSGCFTCSTVVNGSLQVLSKLYPGESCSQITIQRSHNTNDQTKVAGDYRVSLRFFRQNMDFKELLVLKFFTRDRNTQKPPFGWGYHRPETGGSPEAIQFAAKCLQRCDLLHSCYKQKSVDMPTRLLLIGDGTEPVIRLVESAEIDKGDETHDTRYVALSYCWGGVVPIRLMKENRNTFKSGIKWNELPLLFQDVVQLVRKVTTGVRLLWIDALCIIQDSVEDWERECTKMGQVYQDSYLTVAASAAHNCYFSILSTPRIQWNEPLLVSLPNGTGGLQIFVQQAPYHEVEQPLDSRLWAFQEYLMPPRLLRYMSDEIHFECLKLYGCECKPEVHDDGNNEMLETPWNARTLWRLFMDQDTEDLVRLRHEVWKQVITEASARVLTRESDRLPAISGLAILYAAAAGPENRYLAGLWSENIIAGLAWQPMGPGTPSSNQSPSWSWASIDTDGMGHFYSEQTSSSTKILPPGANLVNSWCALKGSNPFGEVTGGCIVLEAPIRLVMLQDIPLAYERSQIFSIDCFSCLGVPLTAYRFKPDSELECSPHTLAGYITARRKRQPELDTSSRLPTKPWSALLLYLSQEPYLRLQSSGFYSINEDVDLHSGDNHQSACKQAENGGCQHEDTRYKSPVKWIDNAETLEELNSDQEIISANFLVLGVCRSGSTKDWTTEAEEAEGVISFQNQTFERLGYYDAFFDNQTTLDAVLADFETNVISIE